MHQEEEEQHIVKSTSLSANTINDILLVAGGGGGLSSIQHRIHRTLPMHLDLCHMELHIVIQQEG